MSHWLRRSAVVVSITGSLILSTSSAFAASTDVASVNGATFGNYGSYGPSVSKDGRFIAFESRATTLSSLNNSLRKKQIFVFDTQTKILTPVTVNLSGSFTSSDSASSAINGDGRYVAFSSLAKDLVSNDTNGTITDIFRRDVASGVTIAVSVNSSAAHGNGLSIYPSISEDGQRVSFISTATNFSSTATGGNYSVFLRDISSNTTTLISVGLNGQSANNHSLSSAISANGLFVAYVSLASNLVNNDLNSSPDIFVYNVVTGATERVSVATNGAETLGASASPSISADGRFVVFIAKQRDTATGALIGNNQVYLRDRKNSTTTLVSQSAGIAGNSDSFAPVIDAVGRSIAYASLSSNLSTDSTSGKAQLFVYDRIANSNTLQSKSTGGAISNNDIDSIVDISDDGLTVAFTTFADNLVNGDTNIAQDVFYRRRDPIPNHAPVANAGADQTLACSKNGTSVFLNGNGSYDPDEDALSFLWKGPFGQVNGATASVLLNSGSSLVDLYVSDVYGGVSKDTVSITLTDTLAPTILVSNGVTLEATSLAGAAYNVDYSVNDNCSTNLQVNVAPTPGIYPYGDTNVVITAIDGANNIATAATRVSVVDTTAPVLTIPADIVSEAKANKTMLNIGTASATDIFAVSISNDAPSNGYALGDTIVTWTAVDAHNNPTQAKQKVSIIDTLPPVVNAGADITLEATSQNGAPYSLNTSVSDQCDCGPLTVTTLPLLTVYPMGSTSVVVTATDSSGNSSSDTVVINVVDTTAPTLTIPADINAEANAILSAIDIGMATASDIFTTTVSNDAPLVFALGTTNVTWKAVDANGNKTMRVQKITVNDTTAPVIQALTDLTVEATGTTTPVTLVAPHVTDIFPVTLSSDAPSRFAFGVTVVTWTATDGKNTSTVTQKINVVDTTPPTLSIPVDMVVEATGPFTPVNVGTATGSDIFGVTLSNDAPATFSIGSTIVIWRAVDGHGLVTSKQQVVTVSDTTPPSFKLVILTPELWAPNRKMILAATVSTLKDLVDTNPKVDIVVSTNSDEHPRQHRRAEHEEWNIVQNNGVWEIWLRGDKARESHTDRVYTIDVSVSDVFGNLAQQQGQVIVPRHQHHSKKHDDKKNLHVDKKSKHVEENNKKK